MRLMRLGLPTATAALMALGPSTAWPAGFGSTPSGAMLGQPLDFSVPVRLDAGEALEARCITAEVSLGDRALPASVVSTAFEMTGLSSARVRVQTSLPIDEPIVGVVLNVGCQARISRRFVLLADPPASASPLFLNVAAAATQRLPQAEPLAEGSGLSAAQARRESTARTGTERQPPAVKRKPRREDKPQGKRESRRVAQRTVAAAPRLQLEAATLPSASTPSGADEWAIEQALLAVAEAASSVRAANDAASAAQQRLAGLEGSLAQARAENQLQRDAAAVMRERMARAENQSNWLWPLLAGLLALSALAAWLAWQLMALRREQRLGWQQARGAASAAVRAGDPPAGQGPSAAVPSAPVLSAPGQAAAPLPVRPRFSAPPPAPPTPAWPPPAPVAVLPPMPDTVAVSNFVPDFVPQQLDAQQAHATAVVTASPASPLAAEPLARDLSIEELIDLEQQAEFFVVLGQDDAAIELLVEHVRSTGGGSPLPYLKLMEIHQRLGDREAYERTRVRFNQRFNAYAPEWPAQPQDGLGLEDYPGVLPRLAQVWQRPLDAMAELEALLFRKSRGDLFDLQAYREVLFLYALARDLLDRESADSGSVDLLLPLSDGGEFSATSPHPYFGLDRDSVFDGTVAEPRPTSAVDLDLSQAEEQPRIFDPLAARRPPGG